MASARDKALLGVAGTVGAGLLSWRVFFPWIGHDIRTIRKLGKLALNVRKHMKKGCLLIDVFEEIVKKHPKKTFIIFEERLYSYEFINDQADRVANIAAKWGLKAGECVAIMMENEPAFIWTFLGLQKLGIASAFINTQVKGQPLAHTLRTCEAKILICGSAKAIVDAVDEIRSDIADMPVYAQGDDIRSNMDSWDRLMHMALPVPVCPSVRQEVKLESTCAYIFTSGTTGLPKPVIMRQVKFIAIASFLQLCDFNSSDIIYITTPLFHTAGGGVGLMNVIFQGATMVLKRKFSAQQFFEDVRKYDVTVIQYIGELCRYLLATPESPLDGKHKVRAAVGNGLRSDIWEKFTKRFRIPNIVEFFASTEGPVGFYNLCNRIGAVGRSSPLLELLNPYPGILVKCDRESGDVIRDKNGHCIPVKLGEPGLLLGSIPSELMDLRFYKGTRDVNEKKVLRNVRKDGDIYFNFGDILKIDSEYFVYFIDRIGDTFRWKGENVATLEVSNVMTQLDVIQDANVYGVEIEGTEGRAGMAAIHLKDNVPVTPQILCDIFKLVKDNLPSYARPVFLRFPDEHAVTTTLKQQKTQYRKQGFHPDVVSDPLFYYDNQNKTYSPLTTHTYSQFLTKSKL